MLEKNIKTPLYEQIEIELKRLINDDKYKQGDLIASESELGREFGASRITIRRAVSDLVDQGYLVKKQGKGTFVQANMVERNLLHLGSYSNFMKNSSKHPSIQIVKLQEIASTDKIAELLNIFPGEPVINLKRLVKFNKEVSGLESAYYSSNKFPKLREKITPDISMANLLSTQYGYKEQGSNQLLSYVPATSELVQYMNKVPGEPLFKLRRQVMDKEVIYVTFNYYDASTTNFAITSGNQRKE